MTRKTSSEATPRRESRVVSTSFDYSLDFKKIDFRQQPKLYRIGRGEQDVLLVEPYKSEILPYWHFTDEDKARISSEKIYQLYDKKGLSGAHEREELPHQTEDSIKAAAAKIFKQKWDAAKAHPEYVAQKQKFKAWLQQSNS